jgi:hypothetical protein
MGQWDNLQDTHGTAEAQRQKPASLFSYDFGFETIFYKFLPHVP